MRATVPGLAKVRPRRPKPRLEVAREALQDPATDRAATEGVDGTIPAQAVGTSLQQGGTGASYRGDGARGTRVAGQCSDKRMLEVDPEARASSNSTSRKEERLHGNEILWAAISVELYNNGTTGPLFFDRYPLDEICFGC
jgi:hypothetical protein